MLREPRARQYQGLVKTYSINHIHHFGRICQLSLSLSLSRFFRPMAETPSSPAIANYEISGIRDCSIEKTLEGTSCSAIPGPRDFSALMCSKSSTGYIQTTVRTDPPRARQRQGLELFSTSEHLRRPRLPSDFCRPRARQRQGLETLLLGPNVLQV